MVGSLQLLLRSLKILEHPRSARARRRTDRRGVYQVPPWLGAALVGGTFVALVWLEMRQPLRDRRAEPKLRRNVRNLAVAATAAAAVQLAEKPLTTPLTRLVRKRRVGLLQQLRLPD